MANTNTVSVPAGATFEPETPVATPIPVPAGATFAPVDTSQTAQSAPSQSTGLSAPTGDTAISAAPKTSLADVAEGIAKIPTDPIGTVSRALDAVTHEIENYSPQGKAEHPILSRIGDVTRLAKELLTGGQSAGKPMGTSSGVVNNPVTTAISLAPAGAELSTAVEARLAQGIDAIKAARAAKPSQAAQTADITEGAFTKAQPGPIPQHGTPVQTPQPLDRATVDRLAGGKNLSTEAFNTLKQHVGGTPGEEIPVGSNPKNLMHRVSEPVQKTLTDTGLAMNKAVQSAPAFKTSTIADPSATLLKDVADLRDTLPLKADDSLNRVVDTQMQAAYPALESKDPSEVLAYRRKLGNQIDWSNITHSPETAGEARNLTQVKVYNALGQKLHSEIPATADLDKVFQPNLELQTFLDKNGVSRDPVEANAEHLSELAKGRNKLAVDAHNAQVAKRLNLAWKILGPVVAGAVGGTGLEMVRHFIGE